MTTYDAPSKDSDNAGNITGERDVPSGMARNLHTVSELLRARGLLEEGAGTAEIRQAVSDLIKQVRPPSQAAQSDAAAPEQLGPADGQSRLPRAHRIIAETSGTSDARSLIADGMYRAHRKIALATADRGADRYKNAVLPSVSPEDFSSNRKLVAAIVHGGRIEGLGQLISQSLNLNSKRGFVAVRDLFDELKRRTPNEAEALKDETAPFLEGAASILFRKLWNGKPPKESDFS